MKKIPELDGLIMTPLQDKSGKVRNDIGRKVRIITIGGNVYESRERKDVKFGRAINKETGKVVRGPDTLTIAGRTAIRGSKGKKWKEIKKNTEPYWMVKLDCNGRYLHLSEQEIEFI